MGRRQLNFMGVWSLNRLIGLFMLLKVYNFSRRSDRFPLDPPCSLSSSDATIIFEYFMIKGYLAEESSRKTGFGNGDFSAKIHQNMARTQFADVECFDA